MKPETKVKLAVWVAFIMSVLSVAASLFVDKTTGLQLLHLTMASVYFSVGYAIHFEKSRPWAIVGIVMSGGSTLGVILTGIVPMLALLAGVQLTASILGFQGVAALNATSGKAAVGQQVPQNNPPETLATPEAETQAFPLAVAAQLEATPSQEISTPRRIAFLLLMLPMIVMVVMLVIALLADKDKFAENEDSKPFGSGAPANAGPFSGLSPGYVSSPSPAVSPCPAGIPADVRVLSLYRSFVVGKNAAIERGGNSYDGYRWYLSAEIVNDSESINPDFQFKGACLTAVAYEVELQSENGKVWKGTGQYNFDKPLAPGWSIKYEKFKLNLGAQPKDGNLLNWHVTKAWGFVLVPPEQEILEKRLRLNPP